MAGKTMTAIISLQGKLDGSLGKAIRQAEKQVSGLGKKLSTTLGTGLSSAASSVGNAMTTAVQAGATAAATAVGLVGTSALKSYASYEQLVGGIDTLFGAGGKSLEEYASSVGKSVSEAQAEYDALISAQNAVKQNAESAFKSAGVSANTYMEQATAFSASLIQGLGGDTQAAVAYADMAIKDMSDNANKMGTDIETIQQTYQSLMRGNYAMLDNLKLGYGGTKSELERLVADASELTGKALDPAKFSDVITAIHAVQEEMGITGTTALEAATTIEGSVNTMKASWSNWLVGLGREDADMGALTAQLLESVGSVVSNVAPRIGVIAGSMVDYIPQAFGGLAAVLGPVIAEGIAGAWNIASSSLGSLGIELPQIDASQVASAFQSVVETVGTLSSAFGPVLSQALSTVAQFAPQLVSSIQPAVEIFSAQLAPAVSSFASSVLPPLMSALSGLLPLLASIAGAVLPPIIGFLTPIISLVAQIASAVIPPLTSAIQSLTPVIQAAITVVLTVASAFSGFVGVVRTVTGPLQAVMSGVSAVKSAFATVSGPLQGAMAAFNAVGGAISSVVGLLGSVVSMAGQAASAIARIGGGVVGGIGSLIGFATGGFTAGPSLAGEDPRYPTEAVISFNPAYRAQNLRYWAMAGRMLGAGSGSSGPTPTASAGGASYDFSGMTFSPKVEVRGNASKEDIVSAIRECEADFVDFILDAIDRRGDSSYA